MLASSRVRRLLAALVVPFLFGALTSCGTDDEQTPADAPAASGSPAEPDAPAEGEEQEAEKADPEETEAPDSGDELNTQTFLPALRAAATDNQSAHMVMDIDAGPGSLTAEGDIRYGENPAMAMTMEGPSFGGNEMEMRVVDGLMYMSLPPMTPPGKFIKVDPSDPNDPMGASMGSLATQMDLETTFASFEAGLRRVELVGAESVSGEDLDRYQVSVDAAAASEAQGQPAAPGMPETIVYDIWLDDDDLMRKLGFELGGQVSMNATMSQWGEPVTVAVPPANKIVKAPSVP
jgi:hypothetical protein